jgi:hypothetical protein
MTRAAAFTWFHANENRVGDAGGHDQFLLGDLGAEIAIAYFANRFGQDPRAAAEAYDALALWGSGESTTLYALPSVTRSYGSRRRDFSHRVRLLCACWLVGRLVINTLSI